MSYARMDHAGWVQSNIAASKRQVGRKRSDNARGWAAAPDKLSPFQSKVMDILGMVGGGIYNAPIAWNGVQWRGWGRDAIAVPWRAYGLDTFDFDHLTRLVFLAHEARIRCEVRVHGPRCFLLVFHQRGHEGGISERHPNLDEAVAEFRQYLPAEHRVVYRVPGAADTEDAA